ncbi:MAG: lipocalin family protein [Flavobacteriales bacterium]
MKRILFVMMAAVAVMFTSCSKEFMLNADIQGSWELSTVNGNSTIAGTVFTFDKTDSDRGKVTMTYPTWNGGTTTYTGTYVLEGDTKITVTPDNGSPAIIYTVISKSDSELKLQCEDDIMVFKKK